MPRMHQEVRIKKDIDVPRLKGRLRPIIVAPIKKLINKVVKETPAVYIEPLPLEPFVPVAVEPKLAEPIQPVIPEYIGGLDEQPEEIRKEPAIVPATDKGREIPDSSEDTPLTL